MKAIYTGEKRNAITRSQEKIYPQKTRAVGIYNKDNPHILHCEVRLAIYDVMLVNSRKGSCP